MIRVAINGAAGRMGKRLVALCTEEADIAVAAALDARGHPMLGRDAGEAAGVGSLGVPIECDWNGDVDVMIDFSSPEGAMTRLKECIERVTAMVIGTTGLTPEQEARVAAAGEKIAVLQAPNMSVGVNLLFNLVGEVAKALGDAYDIEIVEAHHRFKKDAPSGTALRLAERICSATGRDAATDLVHGREGTVGERTRREIGIHAVRGGDIVGDHAVSFTTLGERIELIHRAHTRDTFAHGAIRAARFVAGKPAGNYCMNDVLGLG